MSVTRFARALNRAPRLEQRLFRDGERGGAPRSLAARFAAKEACLKALGSVPGFAFRDVEVAAAPGGAPRLALHGSVRAEAARRGVTATHLSLTHEDPLASAIVLLEGER